ncbi:MAG: bacillithiol biosynthesis cysteine-adding enzyme BshC [Thermoactinomyces sp.]
MRLQEIALSQKSGLLDMYLHDRDFVQSFYEYDPWQEESVQKRARYLEQTGRIIDRAYVVKALRAFHQPELMHPEVVRNLNRLGEDGSMVVIGGQQAGLLGGPLYTFYKAITIIRLARQAEEQLGKPVIPVFWIAGEDHDIDEVDHIWVQTGGGEPCKHRLLVQDQRKLPVSERIIDKSVYNRWLDELAQIVPDSEYKQSWLTQCKTWGDTSLSWTRLFARVLHHFFGKYGLLLVDSNDENLRRIEIPFFDKLIRNSERIARKTEQAACRLQKWDLDVPVDLKKNQGNLFILADDERQHLFHENDDWVTKDGKHGWSVQELLHLVSKEPARFSNNVITRPLMQEALFPVLFFTGGPGEIAYWSLLKEAFLEVNLQMPIIVPRMRVTVIGSRQEKPIHEFSLNWRELDSSLREKKKVWLNLQKPPDLTQAFLEAEKRISAAHRQLVDYLDREIGMNMMEVGEKNRAKIQAQIDYYYQFAWKSLEDRHRASLRKWDQLINFVQPNDKPQERVYNMVWLWNEHGMEWIDFLINQPDMPIKGYRAPYLLSI